MNPFLGPIADLINTVVSRVLPDPEKQAQIQLELTKMAANNELAEFQGQMQLAASQAATNTEEAKSTNWFVAGWRPYIGWVCGTGLLYQYLFYPIIHSFVPNLTALDTGTLVSLLTSMLGIGGMRTYEKLKGAEGNR